MENIHISNLEVKKCPLTCEECKVVYTNREVDYKIICTCICHTNLETVLKEET